MYASTLGRSDVLDVGNLFSIVFTSVPIFLAYDTRPINIKYRKYLKIRSVRKFLLIYRRQNKSKSCIHVELRVCTLYQYFLPTYTTCFVVSASILIPWDPHRTNTSSRVRSSEVPGVPLFAWLFWPELGPQSYERSEEFCVLCVVSKMLSARQTG